MQVLLVPLPRSQYMQRFWKPRHQRFWSAVSHQGPTGFGSSHCRLKQAKQSWRRPGGLAKPKPCTIPFTWKKKCAGSGSSPFSTRVPQGEPQDREVRSGPLVKTSKGRRGKFLICRKMPWSWLPLQSECESGGQTWVAQEPCKRQNQDIHLGLLFCYPNWNFKNRFCSILQNFITVLWSSFSWNE